MSSYLLAHGLAYANESFAGGHLPIRIHTTPAWQAEQQGTSGTSSNGYDYVLLQGPVEIPSLLQQQGMQLRAAHGMWRLYERVATKEPMS